MPTYEYECLACGETFERFQSITAGPVRRCPHCRASKVRRLIGAGAGFLFRGSGFHETDYRSEEYKAKAKDEKKEGAGAESGQGPDKKDSSARAPSKKDSTGKHGAKAKG